MIKQEEISKLKEGRYIVIDGAACVIKKMQRSSPGKHGHAKYRIDAVDIITKAKKVVLYSGHDKVGVPIIDKKPAQVLGISSNTAQVMDMESYESFDLDIPEELQGKIVVGAQVIYWEILGKKVLKQLK